MAEFDLAPYVARLREQLSGWAQIGAAADLAAVEDSPVVPPAVFLIPHGDTVEGNPLAGDFVQHVTVRFGALLAISSYADAVGMAAGSELATRRAQVRAALSGWSPDESIGWTQRSAGTLLRFDDGLMWWTDEYVTDFYERCA